VAKRFGATTGINSADGNALESIMKSTGGRGVDTAIAAVGIQQTCARNTSRDKRRWHEYCLSHRT
jgi:threonine dehydrogenase-like Zn-dependent dehydrogenase